MATSNPTLTRTYQAGTLPPATTPSTPIKAYSDATYRDNDGPEGAGWLIADHNNRPIAVTGELIGTVASSQIAEQNALYRLIAKLATTPANHVIVYTDCLPVIDRVDTSVWDDYFRSLSIEHVSRDQNEVAHMAAEQERLTAERDWLQRKTE
jgi:ribonuclease HI